MFNKHFPNTDESVTRIQMPCTKILREGNKVVKRKYPQMFPRVAFT